MDGRILMALTLSGLCYLLIFGIDQVADRMRESGAASKSVDKAVEAVVGAISVLVGFSWEHTFDGAVTVVSAQSDSHVDLIKFAMGIGVFLYLLTPWRKYILKRSMQLDEVQKVIEMNRRRPPGPSMSTRPSY
mmetsp:Transcript_60368/g.162669  ORF Transcript_60368/g.162669 Transcript_60368/m.162669 type:complete len:133 (-) Transcript_60368:63-461(-)